jgi:hypothetical protein
MEPSSTTPEKEFKKEKKYEGRDATYFGYYAMLTHQVALIYDTLCAQHS